MAAIVKIIYFVFCALCIRITCLQLVESRAIPLSAANETLTNETDCRCSSTNLTASVDGHFLHKWLKFSSHHSIRHLSEAARDLEADTNGLQVRKFNCVAIHHVHIALYSYIIYSVALLLAIVVFYIIRAD